MKEYKYGCDGGCLAIGTKVCQMHIPNDIGDGQYSVFVYTLKDDARDVEDNDRNWKWRGTVEGTRINVYNYDCLIPSEMSENVLCTLSGRYAIYVSRGDIALVKWRKWS